MIFFDIDDTLTDSISAHDKAILSLATNTGLHIQDTEKAKENWYHITETYLARYFQKEMTLQEQRLQRLQSFWKSQGQELSFQHAKKFYPKYHQFYLQHCTLFPDIIKSLNRLKDFPLGIISNGVSKDQHFKLHNNQISNYFTSIVISEDIGYAKPQPEIFHHACSLAGKQPEECTYIGNSYELDYQGAKEVGFRSIWIDRRGEKLPVGKNERFQQLEEAISVLISS